MNLLEISGLSVSIGGQTVCRDLDLAVGARECWAVVGPNGVGKSTLLNVLAGLRKEDHGRLQFGGRSLSSLARLERARLIGLLLQQSERGFPASVLETVLGGRHPHIGRWGWESARDVEVAAQAIAAVGLEGFARRDLTTLSGGELRRVEIARLIAQQPRLALADEPLNHLDLRFRNSTIRLLRQQFLGAGQALVMVLHDLNMALHACEHWLLLLGDGRWRAGPATEVADPALLSELFGQPIRRIRAEHTDLLVSDFRLRD